MATVIRMQRGGRTHDAYYRVVVVDSRTRGQGSVLDQIGVYHPCAKPNPRIELNKEKALAWLAKGAQLSDTARSLFSKQGILAEHAARANTSKASSAG
jgi:small subunit ribosomal protein S16